MPIVPPEMESLFRLFVFVAGLVGGVYAIKRSIDVVSINLKNMKEIIVKMETEQGNLKACDVDLQNHAAQMKVLMEVGAEYRVNVDKVHSDLYSKFNNLNSRVKSCETCNDFIRRDIDNLKEKIDRGERNEQRNNRRNNEGE